MIVPLPDHAPEHPAWLSAPRAVPTATTRQANIHWQAHVGTVLHASPLAIYTLNLHGLVTSWNDAAERILAGLPPKLSINRSPPSPQHLEANITHCGSASWTTNGAVASKRSANAKTAR